MKPLINALLIPETRPDVPDTASLLLFFGTLSFYLPTETDSADNSLMAPLNDLCTGYVPAPLGKDLNRFNRLLRELENSRSDDLARLFSTARSPVATGEIRDRDETSAGNVFAAMHKDGRETSSLQRQERLWQARLMLKLAELLDRREYEVRQGLQRISSAEKKIIAALEDGPDAASDAEPNRLPTPEEHPAGLNDRAVLPGDRATAPSATLINLRLKAWTELFLADQYPDRPLILAASSPDHGSILLDRYETIRRETPQIAFSITLPAISGPEWFDAGSDLYMSMRNKLHRTVRNHLGGFDDFFKKAGSAEPLTTPVMPPSPLEAWEEAIKIEFSGTAPISRKLDFYCFPGIPPEKLLQKLFNLAPLMPAGIPKYSSTLLAVLRD